MTKKRLVIILAVFCLAFAGCVNSQEEGTENTVQTEIAASDTVQNMESTEPLGTKGVQTVMPLPESTMDNLTDATLSVSLEQGDAYVDDSGIMQMKLKVYTYDKYDMVDIANLKVGDTIVRCSTEVEVLSLERNENGTVLVNGGFEADGFDLATDDGGIFYERGFNDSKSWYEIGEVTIRVSADFKGFDRADPDLGEVILYPGSFLTNEVINYDFTPYNTLIRIENGQIVELTRSYTP